MKQSPIVQSKLAKFEYRMKPLIAAEATTFVLIQKVAKNQVIRKASLPHKAIALQIRQNLGCYIFTLLSLHTWPLPFCKNLLMPCHYTQGHHCFA